MKTLNNKIKESYTSLKYTILESSLKLNSTLRNPISLSGRVILFIMILQVIVQPQFAQDSLWMKKSDLQFPRWHTSANHVDGKIYVIGGVENYNKVEAFDIETDSWETKASMPNGRAFVGSGVVDSNVYIIGGSKFNEPALKVVEKYDPVTDEWTTVDSMENARFGMGSCVYNNKIYTFGGNNPAETTVEVYDPVEGNWISDLAAMPTARWEPECVLVGDKIYVIGGFLNPATGAASDDVEMYDPESNTWTTKASLPERRGGGTTIYANEKIYYFGGSKSFSAPLKNVWIYDPLIDQWYVMPDMPFAWFLMSSSVVDDMVYLMAGSKITWPHNDYFKGVYTYKLSDYVTYTPYEPENPDVVEGIYSGSEYRIYPNPATNILHIESDNLLNEVIFRIFNVCGTLQLKGITNQGNVNIDHLNEGAYFIELDDQNNPVAHKFIKISH